MSITRNHPAVGPPQPARIGRRQPRRVLPALAALLALGLVLAGCAGAGGGRPGSPAQTLVVGAIPDQEPQQLQRRYGALAEYLSDKLDVRVRYEPVTDYTASVTAFRRGDLDLVFFGGLTGVQARLQVPGARAIAQRGIDDDFRSVFVAHTGSGSGSDVEPIQDVAGLKALRGHTFTFGSKVSTSGRLMPQYFLSRAGVSLDDFDGQVGFSGSHDKTAELVESGTYEAGALNSAVWDDRVRSGKADTSKVREIFRTPAYHDYHWVIRPDVTERFGDGFIRKVTDALLALDSGNPRERRIMSLFQAEEFIATKAENYQRIERVARKNGLIE